MKNKFRQIIMMGMIMAFGVLSLNLMPVKASLWNLYNELGYDSFPTISERAVEAAEYGVFQYRGTYDQNILLEKRMRESQSLFEGFEDLLGFSVVSRYKTTLSSSMTATQSTIPVSSVTTFDGTTLTMALLGGVEVFFTVEPGSSKEEIIRCTGISGTSWTGCTRGLAFSGSSKASVAANRKTHNAGSVVVMSNTHYVFENFLDIDSDKTASGTIKFANGSATTTVQLGPGNNSYDKCFEITNGDSLAPFLCYDEDAGDDSLGAWTISHDGINSFVLPTSTSGVSTGGLGITLSAGVVATDPAATSTSGLGYSGEQLVNVLAAGGGLEFGATGMEVSTSTDFVWTGDHTFVEVTSTAIFATTVSSTKAFVQSVELNQLVDGSTIESSVHKHDSGISDDSMTIPLTTIAGNWTVGAGTPTFTTSEILFNTDAGENVSAGLLPNGTDSIAQFDDTTDYSFQTRAKFTTIAAAKSEGFGFSESGAEFRESNASVTDSVTFYVNNVGGIKLWARTANGSATTTAEITGITLTNYNTYKVVFDRGVDAKFYVNGTLEQTIATTLPNEANNMYFWAGIDQTSEVMAISTVILTKEF